MGENKKSKGVQGARPLPGSGRARVFLPAVQGQVKPICAPDFRATGMLRVLPVITRVPDEIRDFPPCGSAVVLRIPRTVNELFLCFKQSIFFDLKRNGLGSIYAGYACGREIISAK
jgi:hypothetical protein